MCTTMLSVDAAAEQTQQGVQRINFGVTFQLLDKFYVVSDTSHFDVLIKLPQIPSEWLTHAWAKSHEQDSEYCVWYTIRKYRPEFMNTSIPMPNTTEQNWHRPGCTVALKKLILTFYDTIMMEQAEIMGIVREIHDAIPNSVYPTARGMGGYLGEVLGPLFGLTSQNQFEKLQIRVDNIVQFLTEKNDNANSDAADALKGQRILSQRVDNLVNLLNISRQENVKQTQILAQEFHTELHDTTLLMARNMELVRNAEHLKNDLLTFLRAIYSLKQGIIPLYFIPLETMKEIVKNVKDRLNLQDKTTPLYLTFADAKQAYTQLEFNYFRLFDQLVISLQFSLTPLKDKMQLYEVQTYAIPVSNDTRKSTLLQNDIKFLAVGKNPYYKVLTERETILLQMGKTHMLSDTLLRTDADTSCLMSIYKNDIQKTAKHCRYDIIHTEKVTEVQHLLNTYALFNSNYTITCRHRTLCLTDKCHEDNKHAVTSKTLECKGMCFIDIAQKLEFLPENINNEVICQMTTPNTLVGSKIILRDKNNTSNLTYALNLPMVYTIYDKNIWADLGGNTLFSKLPDVEIPEYFKITPSETNSVIDTSLKLDLSKVWQQTSQRKKVFSGHLDNLIREMSEVQEIDNYSWLQIILIAQGVATGALLLLVLNLMYRLRQLSMLIMLSTRANALEAVNFRLASTTAPLPYIQNVHENVQFVIFTIWPYVIIATLIFLLLKLARSAVRRFVNLRIGRKITSSTLVMQMGAGDRSLYVPLQEINGPAQDLAIQARYYPTHMSVAGYIFPTFHLSWQGNLANQVTKETNILATSVRVTLFEKFQLKNILKSPNPSLFLHLLYNKTLYLVDTSSMIKPVNAEKHLSLRASRYDIDTISNCDELIDRAPACRLSTAARLGGGSHVCVAPDNTGASRICIAPDNFEETITIGGEG
jgi:hypothetical protein